MDIFPYYTRNESWIDGIGQLELDSITWERTHYSPFAYFYALHEHIESRHKNETNSFAADHSAHDSVKFYIECIAISVVGIPGIVGNVLSAIVLLTAKMRSPITYLLLGLALTDLLMILNCLLAMAVPSYFLYFKIDLLQYRFVTVLPAIYAIGKTAHVASVLYALFITMERYFAVMYPLKARLFCTLTRAKITSVIILLFSIIYNIPRFFEYTYVKVPIYPKQYEEEYEGTTGEYDGEYYYFPLTGDLRRNATYIKLIAGIHFSCFYVIPMVLIIYFNGLIYFKLKSARKKRETMTVSQITEDNVTTMLLLIVVVFVMCNCLPFVNLASRILTGSPEIFILDSIRNFLWIFNSSINFVIYYAYSDGFRETCLDLWPFCIQNVCYSPSRKKRLLRYTASGYAYNHSNSSSRMSVSTIASTLSSVKRHYSDMHEGESSALSKIQAAPDTPVLQC